MKKYKKVLVAVSGGIAVYKACELVRLLIQQGCQVKVVMTPAAIQFVTPLTFQTLSGNKVYWDMFAPLEGRSRDGVADYLTVNSLCGPSLTGQASKNIRHISLSDWADVAVVVPATANTLAKIARGICDNLLTTVVCALPKETPVFFAPAMNVNMWNNPITQENIKILKTIKNYRVLNVAKGALACGIKGEGRMLSPQEIVGEIL